MPAALRSPVVEPFQTLHSPLYAFTGVHCQMETQHADRALGGAVVISRSLPGAGGRCADRRGSGGDVLHLRARGDEDERQGWLGGCLEEGVLRLGVRESRRKSRKGLQTHYPKCDFN
jgi:hypothetical protein